MSKKSVRICSKALSQILDDKKISQSEFAASLGIATKTVQRWINGTTKTVAEATLDEIAKTLKVDSAVLSNAAIPVLVKRNNRALGKLTAISYFEKVRSSDDWDDYVELLSSYKDEELSTEQEMLLQQYLGVSYAYLGKFRAARKCLDRALMLSQALENNEEIINIMGWLGICEELRGDHNAALKFVNQVASIATEDVSLPTLVTMYMLRGRVLLHAGRLNGAEKSLRKGIVLGLRDRKASLTRVAVMKVYLGWLYLRRRDLPKAKVTFTWLIKASKAAGWNRGIAIAYYALGVIEFFQSKEKNQKVQKLFGHARYFSEIASHRRMETKLEQLQYVQSVLMGDYAKAAQICIKRLKAVRSSSQYAAFVVVDMLFLSKIENSEFKMKNGLVTLARGVLKRSGLNETLEVISDLEKRSSISTKDFAKLYCFL